MLGGENGGIGPPRPPRKTAVGVADFEGKPNQEIILINENGAYLGVMLFCEAIAVAHARGCELFVVDPESAPQVVRLIRHGQYEFEQNKVFTASKKSKTLIDSKKLKCDTK